MSRLRVFVTVPQACFIYVILEDCFDEPDILVVCYSSSVVDLGAKEVDNLVRYDVIFIKKHFKLSLAHCQVLIGKFVGDVPANWSEFSSVLNNSMEQAETKEKLFECLWFLAVLQLFVGKVRVGTQEIGTKSLWWLNCHLDSVLQDRNWELTRRHRGQPETEILVHIFIKLLNQLFEFWHPTDSKMAVLKDNPCTFLRTLTDKALGFCTLTLAKRNRVNTFAHSTFFGESEEISNWIRTRR